MKTTTRKSTPKLPFEVPVPVQQALKNAGTELDRLGARARTAATKAEKTVRVAARDLKKTGESFAKAPRAFVEDVVETGKDFGEKLREGREGPGPEGRQGRRPAAPRASRRWSGTRSARPSRRACTA